MPNAPEQVATRTDALTWIGPRGETYVTLRNHAVVCLPTSRATEPAASAMVTQHERLLKLPAIAKGSTTIGALAVWCMRRFMQPRPGASYQPQPLIVGKRLASFNRVLVEDVVRLFISAKCEAQRIVSMRAVQEFGGVLLVLECFPANAVVMSLIPNLADDEIGDEPLPGSWLRERAKGAAHG